MKIIPKKSLGQNFLVDDNVVKKICNSGCINEEDYILEIGPGTGKLTEFLILKKPQKLYLIEKDRGLIGLLNKKFKNKV